MIEIYDLIVNSIDNLLVNWMTYLIINSVIKYKKQW